MVLQVDPTVRVYRGDRIVPGKGRAQRTLTGA
jgi:hypothetical protein